MREGVIGSGGEVSLLEGHANVSSMAVTAWSNAELSSVVPATPSGVPVMLTDPVVQETEAADSKDSNKERIGYFDKAMSEV